MPAQQNQQQEKMVSVSARAFRFNTVVSNAMFTATPPKLQLLLFHSVALWFHLAAFQAVISHLTPAT
ncbi:hypothetical protein MHYP_G00356890 [Metynnis hypsauchen]